VYPDSQLTLRPQLDRDKVLTKGKEVTGRLLIELQVRKSTADGKGAKEFYTELTKPSPSWEGEIRDLVLKKKLVCIFVGILLTLTDTPPCSLGRSSSNPTPLSPTMRSFSRNTHSHPLE